MGCTCLGSKQPPSCAAAGSGWWKPQLTWRRSVAASQHLLINCSHSTLLQKGSSRRRRALLRDRSTRKTRLLRKWAHLDRSGVFATAHSTAQTCDTRPLHIPVHHPQPSCLQPQPAVQHVCLFAQLAQGFTGQGFLPQDFAGAARRFPQLRCATHCPAD